MRKNIKKSLMILTVLATPLAIDSLMESNEAQAAQGWVKSGSAWYYYNAQGQQVRNAWVGSYWLGADGKMAVNSWVDGGKYYVGSQGWWVKDAPKQTATPKATEKPIIQTGWVKSGSAWYYYNAQGQQVRNAWVGSYWLGADGKMAVNSWVDGGKYYVGSQGWWVKDAPKQVEEPKKKDTPKSIEKKTGWVKDGNAWYHYNEQGTLTKNAWVGSYWLGADGKMAVNSWVDEGKYYVGNQDWWVKDAKTSVTTPEKTRAVAQGNNATNDQYTGYYKVTGLYIPVYDSNGKILSHISQGTVVFKDARASVSGRIPVQVAGLIGYVNPAQVEEVNASATFIPDYVSDGKYVYHRYSKYSSVKVAYHNPNMQVGKSYYSADGINFGTFKLDHPFQFSNLKTKTNYTAADINKLYTVMGAGNSMLAGKGETFKAAEQKYGVNALYLVAHSALESAWGKSNIAKKKNNFFGIAAYDSSPYTSATKFDDVDSGILGAARWINEKYLSNSSYPARGAHLGNKAGGMNVNYATAPYWGESIASIMFDANERLGKKDK